MPGVTTAYQNGVHGSRPAASAGCILYACSTHSLIYRSDGTSWTTWMTIGSTTTTVASDAIWDAAGDLAVGTGADTAAKVALGAAGGALSVINGAVAWNSGTSFPASKLTGDRYWRTDLGLEFYWDGTRWVTTTLYELPVGESEAPLDGASTNGFKLAALPTDLAVYLVKGYVTYLNGGTNNGSNFWAFQYATKTIGSSGNTNRGGSIDTSAGTSGQYGTLSVTFGIALTTSEVGVIVLSTKTGTPGALYWPCTFQYRKIAT